MAYIRQKKECLVLSINDLNTFCQQRRIIKAFDNAMHDKFCFTISDVLTWVKTSSVSIGAMNNDKCEIVTMLTLFRNLFYGLPCPLAKEIKPEI